MLKAGENSPIWKNVQSLVKDIDLTQRMNKLTIDEKGELSPEDKIKAKDGELY